MTAQNIISKKLDLGNPQGLSEFLEILKGFGFDLIHDPRRREIRIKGVLVYSDLPSKALTLRNKNSEIVFTKNKDENTAKFIIGLRNREIVYEVNITNNIDVYYSDTSILVIH